MEISNHPSKKTRIYSSILVLVVILFYGIECKSQTKDATQLKFESYISALDENQKFMGAIKIVKGNQVLIDTAIGYQKLDADTILYANKNSVYRIGSISKTFTSVLTLQLIEEGKLSLDTKLSEYYPSLKNADKITIKQMLQHRSGLYNYTNSLAYVMIMYQEKSEADLIKMFEQFEPDFEPGEKHEYSNTNYYLLGRIIEKIENETYQEALQNRICEPLGLKHTYFGDSIYVDKKEVHSFERKEGNWVEGPITHMSTPHGAGALVSTTHDLDIFIRALHKDKLLKRESWEQMKKMVDGYGFGLMTFPFYKKTFSGHGGRIDNFSTIVGYHPESDLSMVILSNGQNYEFNEVNIHVLKIAYGLEFEIPSFEIVAVDQKILDGYVGDYETEKMPLDIKIRSHRSRFISFKP